MLKRGIDLGLALLLSALVLPVVLFLCLATVVSLRSWPLFTQDRIGEGGRAFRFVKVRTLPSSAPADADKYTVARMQLPWFSRAMRRYHLDELPQLLLVLKGTMSLVGPRPEMPRLHDGMNASFARERTAVRPGCTGLWQIGDECHRLIGEAPEFDRFYLDNRSARLDLWILWRTVRMVLGAPTVSLDDVPAWALGPAVWATTAAPEPAIGPVEAG